MYRTHAKYFLVLLVILFVSGFTVFAFTEIAPEDITISLNPETPGPNEEVSITLLSYATTLDKDFITWKQDGKTVLFGTGEKSYTTTMGGPSTSIAIDVDITAVEDGSKIHKQIILQAGDLDVLWEVPNSYTPPFYRGKALPTQESIIKVVAIPNMPSNQSSKNTVYNWKLNRSASLNASGYGKNVFLFKNSYLHNSESVEVAASAPGGDYDATGVVTIPIVSPKILFYSRSGGENTNYANSLSGGLSLNGEESTIIAEPYFLGLKTNISDFDYKWKINSKTIDTPTNPLQLTVRPTSSGGYAIIDLTINSISKLFQSASGTLKLNL